jgi:hypothetical protein
MSTAALALFIAAVATLYVGVEVLDAPRVTATGALLLGLSAVAAGIHVLRTGRAHFQPSGPNAGRLLAESFGGWAARVWGVMFVLAGVLTMAGAAAALVAPDAAYATLEQAVQTDAGRGVALALWGTFVGLYGLARALGDEVTAPGAAPRARHLGRRLFGLLCLMAGLLCVTVGVLFVVSPGTPMRVVRSLMQGLR